MEQSLPERLILLDKPIPFNGRLLHSARNPAESRRGNDIWEWLIVWAQPLDRGVHREHGEDLFLISVNSVFSVVNRA
jgi:hypothetical protein